MSTHVWQETHPTHSRLHVTTPSLQLVEAIVFGVGRLIFAGFFFYSGLHHFLDAGAMTPYAAAKGVPFPELAILGTGLLLLIGSVCLLSTWPRAGAWMIMLFLIGVTPVMHAFWNDPTGPARTAQLANFTKNLALFGAACMLAGMPGAWPTLLHRQPHVPSRQLQ